MSDKPKKAYGKYRGTVVNPVDPLMIGRIMVIVPEVLGLIPSSWAMPCFPVAGIQYGLVAIPQEGAGVWVEFEGGDTDRPIWSGCFYGDPAEFPSMALLIPPAVPGVTIQTTLQNSITVSDVPGPTGGILLKSTTGALISISDIGITISNGQGATIVMTGPSVVINEGALTVI